MTIDALVFTDLDGTLLDHDTYEPGDAAETLKQLLNAGASVFFCSAKTLSEQKALARHLDVEVGYITENGAEAVLSSFDMPHRFGVGYDQIRETAAAAAAQLGLELRGYGDMTVQEVAAATNMPLDQASRAKERCCTETLVGLSDDNAARLARTLADSGLHLQRGARFWSIQGDHDKGRAVQWVIAEMRQRGVGGDSFGIGDGPNDVEMLVAVDHPILVKRPDSTWAELGIPGVLRIDAVGPDGWVKAAQYVMGEA